MPNKHMEMILSSLIFMKCKLNHNEIHFENITDFSFDICFYQVFISKYKNYSLSNLLFRKQSGSALKLRMLAICSVGSLSHYLSDECTPMIWGIQIYLTERGNH